MVSPPAPDLSSAIHATFVAYLYRFADVEFDESVGRLRVAGLDVAIEPKPKGLLSELLRRPNEVVSKDELIELLWDGRPTVDNVVSNAVNKLRKALGDVGGRRIVNLPRIGYRFDGSVERIATGRLPSANLHLEPGQPVLMRPGFVLERALGASSRNDVWLATDVKLLERRVFKFAIGAERLKDLKREYTFYRVLRNGLGDRDDFARVLSANFAEAPYFLECEYEGRDLLAWSSSGESLTAMSRAERIDLFLSIASAVAAAHSVGVLHKDLKPANVLVSHAGNGRTIKLTDFGSSRLLEQDRLRELGVTAMGMTMTCGIDVHSLSGTPLYLAPELLAGHAPSTQSDLYALGLILYQMLVGDLKRPMTTGWQRDIDDDLLREDLVAATEGRPTERLGSVVEFIDRLSSLEQRRTAAAQRATERREAALVNAELQRSRARRPWAIATYAALLVGLATSLGFYVQARAALRAAEVESVRATSISDFLEKDVLQSADVLQVGKQTPITALDVLRRASKRAGERFASQPLTEAAIQFRLAQIYTRMASYDDAGAAFKRSLALMRPLLARGDPQILAIRFAMAVMLFRAHDGREATAMLIEAEHDADPKLLAASSELRLLADRARFERLRAESRNREAVPLGREVVALTDASAVSDDRDRFEARVALAELHIVLDEIGEAERLLAEAASFPFDDSTTGELAFARARMALAGMEVTAGNYRQGETEFLRIRDRLVARVGANEAQVGFCNFELGALYEKMGDFVKAADAFGMAAAIFKSSLGDAHRLVKVSTLNRANEEVRLGHSEAALRELEQLRPWFLANGRSDRNTEIDLGRARALSDLGRYHEALALLDGLPREDGLGLDEDVPGTRTKVRAWRQQLDAERGKALIGIGQRDDGRRLVQEALDGMERDADERGSLSWERERFGKLLAKASGG